MLGKVIWCNSWIKFEIGRKELSENYSISFVFKTITKHFHYEKVFFYLGPIQIYKTGLKEPVETRSVVNLLVKKDFPESVSCKTNPLHTKKSTTYIVGKQYLDHEKDVFSDDIGVWVKSKFNFGKWECQFEKY